MDTQATNDFWDSIERTCTRLEYERNLKGLTSVTCPECQGKGHMDDGGIGYDGYGSYHIPDTVCRTCGGRCSVDVACSKEQHLAAIDKAIAELQAKRESLL